MNQEQVSKGAAMSSSSLQNQGIVNSRGRPPTHWRAAGGKHPLSELLRDSLERATGDGWSLRRLREQVPKSQPSRALHHPTPAAITARQSESVLRSTATRPYRPANPCWNVTPSQFSSGSRIKATPALYDFQPQ